MDNWRDPWADHVNVHDESPAKSEVALPQPQTLAPTPVFFDPFVDDAGWGSNQGSAFGHWPTSPHIDAATTQAPQQDTIEQLPNSAQWDTVEHDSTSQSAPSSHSGTSDDQPAGQQQWASPGDPPNSARWDTVEPAEDNKHLDDAVPKTPESPPTIQPDDAREQLPLDAAAAAPPRPDDDSSAHPSTSPSEASHHGAPVESPRTSFEEENATNTPGAHQAQTTIEAKQETEETAANPPSISPDRSHKSRPATAAQEAAAPAPFSIDASLMADLFPSSSTIDEFDDAPDDPIYSTEARKAWYRLTRKQTMREYNAGNDDDSYLRVTWANSRIRLQVNDIVGRWAREDRISGTGAGARASFYWDTTAPLDLKTTNTHVRTMSAASNATPIVSVRQSLPPLPSNSSVAFDWSSPTASANSWQNVISGMQSTSSHLAPKHAAITKLQGHGARSASVDLSPRTYEQVVRKEAVVPVNETSAVRTSNPPPYITPTADATDKLDTNTTSREESVSDPVDDDDDWGEMVQSPVITIPYPPSPFSHPMTRSDTLQHTSTMPQLVEASPAQNDSTETMHASPVVRLRSTISPTSALFKKNNFVPLSVEPGPFGPDMLKPVNRSAGSALGKEASQTPNHILQKSTSDPEKQNIILNSNGSKESSAWHTPILKPSSPISNNHLSGSTSQSGPAKPSSPSPQIAAGAPLIDSWADADFSFFESTVSPQPPTSQCDSSDPFSIFNNSTSESSPAQPFSHSPQTVTPPPLQPLTGATNSAQRRKVDEDSIIREIIAGLPDLMYMLR